MERLNPNTILRAAELLDRSARGHRPGDGRPAEVVEQVLIALVASGHVLIEGVPGLGKTLLVRALAQALRCRTRACSSRPT